MNRNRFKSEIQAENRNKRNAIIISFLLLCFYIASMLFILYVPTNKKIMAPIEALTIKNNLT